MSHQIREYQDSWELQDSDGNTITTGTYPLKVPDDIINGLISDMGVGKPQAEAFKVLFKQDWTFPDRQN